MLYTLWMFWWWGLLLGLIGGWVGWSLRSLRARRQPRSQPTTADEREMEQMRDRLAEFESVIDERNALLARLSVDRRSGEGLIPLIGAAIDDAPYGLVGIGRRRSDIRPDDLTAVKGIGPKIAELCAGIGVTTWRELADTPVEELESMLAAAGSLYQVHDPSTWPTQAQLLADGELDEFVALVDELDAAR